jgi:hypothetical protein
VAVTYFQALMILEASRKQLRKVPLPPNPEGFRRWVRLIGDIETRAADAACEEFALQRRWPAIRLDAVMAQVWMRIDAAVQVCRVCVHEPPVSGLDEREFFRRLLLDYWHGRVQKIKEEDSTAAKGPDLAAAVD